MTDANLEKLGNKISIVTNTAYLMNMWFQKGYETRIVDGDVLKFIKQHHEKDWKDMTGNRFMKVTFEVVTK